MRKLLNTGQQLGICRPPFILRKQRSVWWSHASLPPPHRRHLMIIILGRKVSVDLENMK